MVYEHPFIATASCILGTLLVILTAMQCLDSNLKEEDIDENNYGSWDVSFLYGMIAVYLLMTQFNLINRLWGLF